VDTHKEYEKIWENQADWYNQLASNKISSFYSLEQQNDDPFVYYILKYAFKMIDVIDKKIILDVGCADGRNSILFAKSGAKEIHGVDISPTFISAAQRNSQHAKLNNIYFYNNPIELMSLENDYFDVIFGTAILHHIPNLQDIFSNFKDWLKPGGKLIFTEPLATPVAEYVRKNIDYRDKKRTIDEQPLTSKEYIRLAQNCGLEANFFPLFGPCCSLRKWFVTSDSTFKKYLYFDSLISKMITKSLDWAGVFVAQKKEE